jgi:uncharacterized protein YjbJ (UPF0337 family)
MNTDIIKGKWDQVKAKAKKYWSMADADIEKMKGNTEELLGYLEEKFGYTRDKAKHELKAFIEKHGWAS